MKYFVFKRESNKFDDILSDVSVKKAIKTKMTFGNHLILGFVDDEATQRVSSYMMLKYGDDSVEFNKLAPDRTPVPYVDYVPVRKPKA